MERIFVCLAICGLTMAATNVCTPTEGGDDGMAALMVLSTAVVPPKNCQVTSVSGGGGTTTGSRVFYTAGFTAQSIFTAYSDSVDSTNDLTVVIQVYASAGTKLEITDFEKSGTSTRVLSAVAYGDGCPVDFSTATSATEGTDYKEIDATSTTRYVEFLKAGSFQIQLYTGDSNSDFAPDPLPSDRARPQIRVI